MLTAFFILNRDNPEARQYLYQEIPYHFVYNKNLHMWTPRQRDHEKTIARVQFVYPSSKELFHLRLLLQHVRGPTSFEDLLTVNGVPYTTFSDACVARGLVITDEYIREMLDEAIQQRIFSDVRFLFAHVLIHCQPVDPTPLSLWNDYGARFSVDYVLFQGDTLEIAIQRSLCHIKYLLGCEGKLLSDYYLPEPTMNLSWRVNRDNMGIVELTPEEYLARIQQLLPTLEDEQLEAYNAIVNSMEMGEVNEDPNGKLFFIDGPGGTGKTYLINVSSFIYKPY